MLEIRLQWPLTLEPLNNEKLTMLVADFLMPAYIRPSNSIFTNSSQLKKVANVTLDSALKMNSI